MSGTINFQFNKLLPSTMQGVDRWVDFMDSYQEVFQQYFDERIVPIQDQYDFDYITKSGCVNLSAEFGYTISNYTGYTDTLDYFKREVETIPTRIKTKTNRNSYIWTMYVYYMSGEVYPLYYEGDILKPITGWWTFNENPEVINTLDYDQPNILYYVPLYTDTPSLQIDAGATFDTFIPVYGDAHTTTYVNPTLDSFDVLTLDGSSFIDSLARKVLVNYMPLLCESSSYFLSENTMKAFYNDTQKNKRITEQLLYEPILKVNYKDDNTKTTTNYYSIDDKTTLMNTQETIMITGTMPVVNVGSIRLGNGRHGIVDGSITDVASLVMTLNSGDIEVTTDSYVTIRRNLTVSGTMPNFSEMAVFDITSGCVLYSAFPAINYYSEMISGVKFDFMEV